ncbi:hypothetical protein Tco_0911221 [Tanacetum coccineum]|uniref:Uncharacterized protein n=1 Tax=Tanacetum coccineum TaxID=301880 RepID=A0ABQ5CYB5_9ASTR
MTKLTQKGVKFGMGLNKQNQAFSIVEAYAKQSKNLEALSVVGTQVQNSCSSDQQKFYAMQILDQKELNMKQKHRWNENALRFGALVMTIGLESFLKQILEELRLEGTKAGNIKNGGC